jgi:hypothetical protein
MKTLASLLLILSIASPASAGSPKNSMEDVKTFKESIEESLFRISGVNGVGIGGCDPATGKATNFRGDYVFCVTVFTETQEAAEHVNRVYPEGRLVNGIYVRAEAIGRIEAQPRVTITSQQGS